MEKNKRIDTIVSLLNKDETLLDIGCDHGYVIKKAIDNKIITNAIASDISINALNQAKTNLTGYPVKLVLSNGFDNITMPFKQVVIAGMGTNTIMDILDKRNQALDITYLLQANDRHYLLRKYLMNNDFKIIDEVVVFDGFYYIIIKAVKGHMKLTEKQLHLGPVLLTKKSSLNYYRYKKDYIDNLLRNHGKISNSMLEKYEAFKYAIDLLEGEL